MYFCIGFLFKIFFIQRLSFNDDIVVASDSKRYRCSFFVHFDRPNDFRVFVWLLVVSDSEIAFLFFLEK